MFLLSSSSVGVRLNLFPRPINDEEPEEKALFFYSIGSTLYPRNSAGAIRSCFDHFGMSKGGFHFELPRRVDFAKRTDSRAMRFSAAAARSRSIVT